jgi:hypothetical protein
MVIPATRPQLTQPYLTPAQFQAYPTWLDLDNLIPGGLAAVQADVLADVLLAASDWCVGQCSGMPLHAHWVQNEQLRTRANGSGRVFIRPRDIPVRAITALSWGTDPAVNAVTLPDPTMRVEDGREVSFVPGGGAQTFTGPAIQFGPQLRSGLEIWITWSYVPGYPSTVLAALCTANAGSVTVTDPAGIGAGDILRIYDAGVSEALTVASTYVPAIPTVPPTATSIPLAASTQFAHAAGVGITEMPRRLLQAVIAYGVALLMREDVSEDEPVSAFGPAARTAPSKRTGQAAGLVNDAVGWLAAFRPTYRS